MLDNTLTRDELLEKLNFFLKKHNIEGRYKDIIVRKAERGNFLDIITAVNAFGWAGTPQGYVFWYFLNVRWSYLMLKVLKRLPIDSISGYKKLEYCLHMYSFSSNEYPNREMNLRRKRLLLDRFRALREIIFSK